MVQRHSLAACDNAFLNLSRDQQDQYSSQVDNLIEQRDYRSFSAPELSEQSPEEVNGRKLLAGAFRYLYSASRCPLHGNQHHSSACRVQGRLGLNDCRDERRQQHHYEEHRQQQRRYAPYRDDRAAAPAPAPAPAGNVLSDFIAAFSPFFTQQALLQAQPAASASTSVSAAEKQHINIIINSHREPNA
jgi:hypothetical protein